jgi:hypothetical protein
MRGAKYVVLIAALSLLVSACTHHRGDRRPGNRGPDAMTMHDGGGPHGCSYKSRWFSEGAVRSNDGVCQACQAGRWVPTEGCRDYGCPACPHCDGKGCSHCDWKGTRAKKGSAPCPYGPAHRHQRR